MVNHRREFDPPLDNVLAEMARRGRLCVKALDEALADGREFILGDEFSAADISLGMTSPVELHITAYVYCAGSTIVCCMAICVL